MKRHHKEITLPGRGKSRLLSSNVLQSPLAGVSDQVFRKLIRRWAPDSLLFAEMINATSLEMGYGISKIEELSEEEGPIGVQLFDHRPDAMVEAARRIEGAGAFLIDINMGCPVKKIATKGGGSALLKEPNLAAKIVKEVANAVKIPVTVKTRLGWCHKTRNTEEFAISIQESGAQLLTLHGRTREQGFKGSSDWHAIARVKQALKIPVIANGDITSAEDAARCLTVSNADGVMVGRGSLGAPWLIGQIDSFLKGKGVIKEPSAKEKIILTLEHLENLLNAKGDHGLLIARKHMNWTCRGFQGSSRLRHSLVRAETPSEAIALLDNQLKQLT